MTETYQILQYVSIPLTFVFMLGCTLLPWKIKNYKNSATYLSIVSCFGSGVILGAAFCHMIPHAMESFEKYFEYIQGHEGHEGHEGHDEHSEGEEGHHHAYPWAMLIAILVLLLLITVDTVAHSAQDKVMGEHHNHNHGDGGHNHLAALFTDKPETRELAVIPIKTEETSLKPESQREKPKTEQPKTEQTIASLQQLEGPGSETSTKCHSHHSHKSSETSSSDTLVRGTRKQIIQAYIFFVALSLHAITDGLSIGAHEEESAGTYGILIAVIAHKALDGLALGIPLYYAKLPKFHTIFAIIVCCLMTPLGIGIGIAATKTVEGGGSNLAKAITVSISLGSFIFISLWEMLPAGLNHGKKLGVKLVATLLGWGLMALLALWV